MRKIIYLSILLFTNLALSQGNLQFNQVKLVSSQETVPAGKVWKVENATYNGGAPFCISSGTNTNCGNSNNLSYIAYVGIMSYNINSQVNYIINTFTNNGGASAGNTGPPFPFWLPASSTLAAGTNMRYLSVLEFNIVQ